jgi:hypothetical protein
MYDGGGFLPQYFSRIDALVSYQHFYMKKDGTVTTRLFVDEPDSAPIQPQKAAILDSQQLPEVIPDVSPLLTRKSKFIPVQ